MVFYSNFRVHLNFNAHVRAQKFFDNMRLLYFSMTNDMSLDKLNKKTSYQGHSRSKIQKNSQNMVN